MIRCWASGACRGSSPTVREGGKVASKRPPLQSGYCPDTFCNSIQIVNLQSDGRGTGPFEAVENPNYVTIRKSAWRFDEYSFFYAYGVRQIGAIAKFIAINVILKPLLKQIGKRSADFAGVVY